MLEMQSESHSDPSCSCPRPCWAAAHGALFLAACSCGRTMPVTNGVKYAIALRSFKLSLWGAITILPWRIFRDVFFERFMADRIVKRINPLVAKAFPQHYFKKNKS